MASTGHSIIENVVAPLLGVVLSVSGLYGIFRPVQMAEMFGVLSVGPKDLVFYPGLAGRNLSAGLAVFALLAIREYKALGYLLLCWVNTGIWDIYVMTQAPEPKNGIWGHVQAICLFLFAGSGLAGLW